MWFSTEVMQTRIFRMGKGTLALHLLAMYAVPWLLVMAILAVVALLCAIFVDLRWGVVSLMLVFLILPMLLAFLYYYYGLQHFTAVNTVFHDLTVGDHGLIVTVYEKKVFNGEEESGAISGESDFLYEPLLTNQIPFDNISRIKVGMKSVTLPVKGKGFIWIPASAFGNDRDFAGFVKLVSTGMTNNRI